MNKLKFYIINSNDNHFSLRMKGGSFPHFNLQKTSVRLLYTEIFDLSCTSSFLTHYESYNNINIVNIDNNEFTAFKPISDDK